MRILYVTNLWSGFKDIIIHGHREAKGMPAFIKPLKSFIEKGNTVDFVIVSHEYSEKDLQIKVEWLKNSNFYFVDWYLQGIKRIFGVIKLYKKVKELIDLHNYDFVYGHGTVGVIGTYIAEKRGVANGLRLYGTFLYRELNKSKLSIFLKHPLEYLSYKTKKGFLLMTNDGTRGDKVFFKISNGKNKDFYFWLNGVDMKFNSICESHNRPGETVIFYPARIAKWKRQHLALDIIEEVVKQKPSFKLVFAGHISDQKYYRHLLEEIKKRRLERSVYIKKPLDKEELHSFYKKSLCVLSLYETSNLGNVLIEALSIGGIIITLDDGSTDGIIENGYNGFKVSNVSEATNVIIKLSENQALQTRIRNNAMISSREIFDDWEKRIEKEYKLIQEVVRKYEKEK